MKKLDNFNIEELVCPHIYKLHGDRAWAWMDPRLFAWLGWFRKTINKPVRVNWKEKGLTQRGLRCNICDLTKAKSKKNISYNSAHIRFQAVDFNVDGMTCEEVRKWLIAHKDEFPVNIRLEAPDKIERVHVDVCNTNGEKIEMFVG